MVREEKYMDQQFQIDANQVIQKLVNQAAQDRLTIALLQTQVEQLSQELQELKSKQTSIETE